LGRVYTLVDELDVRGGSLLRDDLARIEKGRVAASRLQGRQLSGLREDELGGVDKFEPVSGGGEMDHSEKAAGQLIVSAGNGAVDLEVSEHALDSVALFVERPAMLDLHAPV